MQVVGYLAAISWKTLFYTSTIEKCILNAMRVIEMAVNLMKNTITKYHEN